VNREPSKRERAVALLREFPQLSDREIARQVGAGNKSVSRWRASENVSREPTVDYLTTAVLLQQLRDRGLMLSPRHSARGEHGEAERLMREAVDLSLRSDSPFGQGNALSDLAEVLLKAGASEEAAVAFEQALACYQRKPIIPLVRRTRERLAVLEQAS
jgi:hypothetical protein